MIGIPYNPDNCIFIASQALNADQFNPNVPDDGNKNTHNMLWDAVAQSLIWVDTKTNLIALEIKGSTGTGTFPFGTDTGAVNAIQVAITGATLTDGYIFEVKIANTNTGATTLQINALGVIPVVDGDGNPLLAGTIEKGIIYLFTYNSSSGSYQLLGESKPTEWSLNGNTVGSIKSIGTLDNFDLPFILNGQEVGRMVPKVIGSLFDGEGRFLWGQTQTDNGSNAGFQTSCTRPNRAQFRFNQYGANNAAGGITTFKSRSLIIGAPITPAVPANNVQVGDIIQGSTGIGLTDNGAGIGLIPIAYTQRIVVTQNANGNVACDWEVSLCPLNGATNSLRKAFGFTSEGIQKTLETANGMSGLAVLDAVGKFVVANTNVKASTKFMLTVQDGGAAPTGNVFQAARINGTSFTIQSNTGALDAGVQVYYQLYEPV